MTIFWMTNIHFCPQKTIERLLRVANHGLIFIERCIEHHRHACNCAKALDQTVVSRIGSARHRLRSAGAVDMGDGGNELPFLFANLEHLHHEWYGIIFLEPLRDSLFEYRWCKWAK